MLAAAPNRKPRLLSTPAGKRDTPAPPQDISAHLAIRQRDREFRMPQGVETLQVSEARARQLFDWGSDWWTPPVLDPSLFNESETERSAAQAELLETLLGDPRRGQ